MTDKALEANRRNAQLSTGPVTPEGKGRITANALKHAFFANQKALLISPAHEDCYDTFVNGLVETYHPVTFQDWHRAHRLALLYYKRWTLLDNAEAGEIRRSVTRHRRAVRFAAGPLQPAELLLTDPAALRRRSDGMGYVADLLEDLRDDIREMQDLPAMLAAAQALAAKLQGVMPDFPNELAESLDRVAVIRTVNRYLIAARGHREMLIEEETTLQGADEVRRLVPSTKHYERIQRALREVNREIRYLEWCLAPLMRSSFRPR